MPEATEQMRARVAAARVARLATIDPDGRPNLVPFCHALDGDTLFFEVDRKPKTTTSLRRVENILARPDVTVLIDHYEEDWTKAWWVRLRGRGRVLAEGDDYEHGYRLLHEKYPQMRDDPPPPAVIAIEIIDWRDWSYEPER